jgi:hypothetical protein
MIAGGNLDTSRVGQSQLQGARNSHVQNCPCVTGMWALLCEYSTLLTVHIAQVNIAKRAHVSTGHYTIRPHVRTGLHMLVQDTAIRAHVSTGHCYMCTCEYRTLVCVHM